jgi:hypothetical protein
MLPLFWLYIWRKAARVVREAPSGWLFRVGVGLDLPGHRRARLCRRVRSPGLNFRASRLVKLDEPCLIVLLLDKLILPVVTRGS